jgi:anti-sigma regulatory factor (Ser/Thr protein kinase)
MTLELHATPGEVMRAVEELQEFGRRRGFDERRLFGLALALEECASNVVNHALRREATRTFRVSFEQIGDSILVELRDRGPEFDPTVATDRARRTEEDDAVGGWGIELVRRHIDQVRYARENDENVLRLTRRMEGGAPGAPI